MTWQPASWKTPKALAYLDRRLAKGATFAEIAIELNAKGILVSRNAVAGHVSDERRRARLSGKGKEEVRALTAEAVERERARLAAKDRRITDMVADGASDSAIADDLGLSVHTITNDRYRLGLLRKRGPNGQVREVAPRRRANDGLAAIMLRPNVPLSDACRAQAAKRCAALARGPKDAFRGSVALLGRLFAHCPTTYPAIPVEQDDAGPAMPFARMPSASEFSSPALACVEA